MRSIKWGIILAGVIIIELLIGSFGDTPQLLGAVIVWTLEGAVILFVAHTIITSIQKHLKKKQQKQSI